LRVEVFALTSEAAGQYAEIRAALEKFGRPMGNMDMLIAAHALAANTILVTHDRVFRRVKGLKTKNWSKA
jgi:tRNA(fMet)-specific endonuclease VapC